MSFLSFLILTASTPAFAQVTVDLHALQALPERPLGRSPSRPAPSTGPAAPTTVTRVSPANPQTTNPPTTNPPTANLPPVAQPAMPESIPETATISPIAPPQPQAGSPPPPPPPVSDQAAAAPATASLRVTFAPGQSDLSPDSATSIKHLTESAAQGDGATFNVLAYAPGKPDDPSTARRVSLSRAMSVRNALVASGIPSARIFVRALGEQFGDGPPDRVDIGVTGAPSASATAR